MGGSTLSLGFLKNISSVLSGSALSPAPLSQSRHVVYPSRMASSIRFQLSPQAKMAPLSIYCTYLGRCLSIPSFCGGVGTYRWWIGPGILGILEGYLLR